MSVPETKEKRTLEQIQQDYNQEAAALGDRTFRIKLLEAEVRKITLRMNEIGKEADAVVEAEKAAANEPK